MRRLIIFTSLFIIGCCLISLLSGCCILGNNSERKPVSTATETYNDDRKTEILEKEGLSEDSLNLHQLSVVESALSIFNYLDSKYTDNDFKYECITPSEMLNGNTATLKVQSEYGIVESKRNYNGEIPEFSDNYEEVKAGYLAKVEIAEYLSKHISSDDFFITVNSVKGTEDNKWGYCGSIYFYADGSSISEDDFKKYIKMLEDYADNNIPVRYNVWGYLAVDKDILCYYMYDTKGNYNSRDFILEYGFKEYTRKN